MILPVDTTTLAEFQATTFGSLTSCRIVTDLCDIVATDLANTSYHCTVDTAGLNFSGRLIQAVTEDSDSTRSGFKLRYYTDSSMSTLSNTNELVISPQSDDPMIIFTVVPSVLTESVVALRVTVPWFGHACIRSFGGLSICDGSPRPGAKSDSVGSSGGITSINVYWTVETLCLTSD